MHRMSLISVVIRQRPNFYLTEPLSLCYGANFDLSKIGGKMEMADVHFFYTEPARVVQW